MIIQYGKIYGGIDPQLIEAEIFKVTISLTPQVTQQVISRDERTTKILIFCQAPKAREEIQELLNLKNREYFRKEILNPLLEPRIASANYSEKINESEAEILFFKEE